MKTYLSVLLLLIAIAIPSGRAVAQDISEEIVVSGSRIGSYRDITVPVIPVVHLKRRADFIVVNAYIESDSRDEDTREREVNSTLRSLQQQANRADNIELGLTKTFETDEDEINYVVPFELAAVEMGRGYRPDTSRVSFVIKSPIADSDQSPDKIAERVEDFIDSVRVTGRAEVGDTGEPNLSIVNIAQYREPLLQLIADDAAKMRAIFGDDYKVSVSGLQEPVRWRVVGPVQLAIFFPYYSNIGQ